MPTHHVKLGLLDVVYFDFGIPTGHAEESPLGLGVLGPATRAIQGIALGLCVRRRLPKRREGVRPHIVISDDLYNLARVGLLVLGLR